MKYVELESSPPLSKVDVVSDSDRHLKEIVRAYRLDPCLFLKSIRVFPLASSERDFIANAIVTAANSEKVIFDWELLSRKNNRCFEENRTDFKKISKFTIDF